MADEKKAGTEATKQYEVKKAVTIMGQQHQVGEKVDLTEEEAKQFVEDGSLAEGTEGGKAQGTHR